MTIYTAIVKGGDRHNILGTFSTLAGAEAAGVAFLMTEQDGYHSVTVIKTTLDVMPKITPSTSIHSRPDVKEHVVGCYYRAKERFEDISRMGTVFINYRLTDTILWERDEGSQSMGERKNVVSYPLPMTDTE